MINWHRLFGLTLVDYFTDTGYSVELEKDLSLKQQFVDVIIIEQGEQVRLADVPDGLDNLGRYNLMTYKSLREPLDGWALDELIGHYVNYRKQISPSLDRLRPADEFRLYGVCTRTPENLQRDTSLQPRQPGVYDLQWGSRSIRILVLGEMPPTEQNAMWELFSGVPRNVRYGAAHYQWHRADHSTITNQLYQTYAEEGMIMPYTFDDFYRDFIDEHWKELVKRVPAEKLLKEISPDDVVKVMTPEEILKRIEPDEILKCLAPDDIEAYLQKLRAQQSNN